MSAHKQKYKTEFDIAAIMFGFTFFSGSMLVGRQIAESMPVKDVLLCFVVGGIVLGLFGGCLAFFSSAEEKDLSRMSQETFGVSGYALVVAMIAITQIGWFGVGASMLSVPLSNTLFRGSASAKIIITVAFGAFMLVSATGGMKFITNVSYLAVPIIFICGFWGILYALKENGREIALVNNGHMSASTGISMVIGTYIAGAITTPNFTYIGKRPKCVSIITFLAFFLGNGLMLVFGAVSYYLVRGDDIFDLFRYFGLTGLGFTTLALNIWSSCDNGLYSAGIGICDVFHIERRIATFVAGVIGIIFSPVLYNHLINFLVFLNRLIPEVGVIIIMHELMKKRFCSEFHTRDAIIALIVGDISACICPIGMPAATGMVVSGLLYYIMMIIDKTKER